MVIPFWVLTITHTLPVPATEHRICYLGTLLNGWGTLLLLLQEFSVKYIRSGLEASLPAPCKGLRQGCCSIHASSQYHPSISHSNSWILCWLLSSSCKLLKQFVHLGTLAPTTLTSAFRGLPDSGVPSLKLKAWAGFSVLMRSFWAMMETISHSV